MPEITAGQKAPDFEVETDQGRKALAGMLEGGKLVLAFYYEDMTPTCSRQVGSFRDGFETLQDMGASVLAISSDSLESHKTFCERLGGLPFPLGSDPGLSIARAYGVVDEGGKRSRRAVFVMAQHNPTNVSQFEQVFRALGA